MDFSKGIAGYFDKVSDKELFKAARKAGAFSVQCSGGCGREVQQYTVGQRVWCAECGKRGLIWDPQTGITSLGPAKVAADASDQDPKVGSPVVVDTPGEPGHNRIGVVSGILSNGPSKPIRYVVDFEGGPLAEDCGVYEREHLKRWGT